ncbi:zinc/manganese transport system substrate-binding protein [Plantibacter flavus]|uniref:Zinc/manganese transport system substrate-binding protein n=1 Tax=Plantibacter flavus TaxID=150123 RepID=A0A3N2BZD5_9MICO|nr:zinc ABC transporter substrate-binding protein AztC [Plantibacter flavus]ROR80635.1 zinc/manganese transport system substrate-binding protein [Plantibacter flavus]SMG32663.1 zinc/manganese transport system substrate-binding protein [Plantibacter flavus]
MRATIPRTTALLRTTAVLTAGLVLGSGLTSCAASADDRPLVVVTTNILGDVVGGLVGDQAEVLTLMPPDADPHSFEISARQAARITGAQLLVSNGLGLEEGLTQHLETAADEGVPIVEAGSLVDVLKTESGATDPHFWTDPTQMTSVVAGVTEALLEEIPALDAAELQANAAAYTTELETLDTEMAEAFAAIPAEQRKLVTNHHVFGYLAARYDFQVIGAVIPSGTTLAAPSASDLDELSTAIEEAGVRTIFADSSQPDRLVQVLADESDVDVDVVPLFTESLTAESGDAPTYLTMMRANTERIATGLSP